MGGRFQVEDESVVMRDYAGENISNDIKDFLIEMEVKDYVITPYEPWTDGSIEAGSSQSLRHMNRGRTDRLRLVQVSQSARNIRNSGVC